MSIIHEALKKAQDSLKHLPPPAPAASVVPQTELRGQVPDSKQSGTCPLNSVAPQPQLQPLQPSMAKPAPAIPMKYLVLALIAVAALFAIQQATVMLTKLRATKTEAMAAPSVPDPVAVAAQAPSAAAQNISPTTPAETDETASAPEPESYAQKSYGSQLVLNGVTITNGQKMALINNGIYQIGEEIMGKTIVNISLDGVELMDGDQKIILKTR